ncbi:uncharacterized protein [Anabrus simplex]|uniref:uncharacterized protein n=1 Tax=Anabrus simplex TaxID=316456 RepID=UPI0035A261FC
MLLATVYLHLLVSLAVRITGVSSVPVIFHKNSVLGPLGLVSDDNIVGPLGIISHHDGIIHPLVPHHIIAKAHPHIVQPIITSHHGIIGPHELVHHHHLIGPHLIVHKDFKFLHPVKPVHHFVVHHGPHFIVHKDHFRTFHPVHHVIGHHPAVLVPHKLIHHKVLPHKHKFIHHAVHPHIIAHHGGFLRVADPEEVVQGPLSELGKFIGDMLTLGGIEGFGEETREIPVNYDESIEDITDKQKYSEPKKEVENSEECSEKTSKEIADGHEATSTGYSEGTKKGGEVPSHLPDHESPHPPAEVVKSPGDKQQEVAPEPSTNVAEIASPSKEHSEHLAVEKKRPEHASDQHVHTSGLSLLPGLQHAGAGVNVYHRIGLDNTKHLTGYKEHEYDHENEDFGFEPNRFCLQVPMPYHHGHHDRGYDTHKFGVEGGGSKGLGKVIGLGGKLGIL